MNNIDAPSGGSTFNVSFTSNVQAGDLIVIPMMWEPSSPTASVTDTLGDTYLVAAGPTAGLGPFSGTVAETFYTFVRDGGSGPLTVHYQVTGATTMEATQLEYSGVEALDVAVVVVSTSSTVVDSGVMTLSGPQELLLGWADSFGNITDAGSGFIVRSSIQSDIVEDMVSGAPGDYWVTTANSTDPNWILQAVAFKSFVDAGSASDGGSSDGGSPGDGGSAGDGGAMVDGGSTTDGGSVSDGGSVIDGGSPTDAGTTDAGNVGPNGARLALAVGCDCGHAPLESLPLVAVLLLGLKRRAKGP
jgi:hypothetical protein